MSANSRILVLGSGVTAATQVFGSSLTNIWTFATLPASGSIGDIEWTSDAGLCAWNGTSWVAVSSTSGAPIFATKVSATLAATQNNYSPTGFSALISRALFTAASGGSTITGLNSTGFADGQLLVIRNPSATDSITFTNLDSNSTAANQFRLQNSGSVLLPPYGGAFAMYETGIAKWVFQ
jgi:hypothetical protein